MDGKSIYKLETDDSTVAASEEDRDEPHLFQSVKGMRRYSSVGDLRISAK